MNRKIFLVLFIIMAAILTCFLAACDSSPKTSADSTDSTQSNDDSSVKNVVGISVVAPENLSFLENTCVDKDMIEVTIEYDDGQKIGTKDYSIEYQNNGNAFSLNDEYFTVIYGDFSSKVNVTVERDNSLKFNSNLYDPVVENYLKSTTSSSQINYLESGRGKSLDSQNCSVKWREIDGASKYLFHLSLNETFTEENVFSSETCEVVPGVLIPDTEYFAYAEAINDDGEVLECSDKSSFKVDSGLSVRIVNIDGVYNVRDLGGWSAGETAKVKYGLLYRGGNLSGITESGKDTFANVLKIKNEIDVRTDGTQNAVVGNVRYNKMGIWQYSMIIPEFKSEPAADNASVIRAFHSASPAAIKQIFDFLANEDNYPVYFHCRIGADRTGTLAFLINGLLGVEYSDLIKDFELTTFSLVNARYRSSIKNGLFTTSGIMENTTNNYIAFGELYRNIIKQYGKADKPLSYAIANYLVKVCGVSEDTIKEVRRILLSEEVSFDEDDIYPVKVNGEEILSKDGVSTITIENFNGVNCYKAVATAQDQLCIDISKINSGTKLTFKMFIPSDSGKLEGLGEMAIRVKNPDKYIAFSTDQTDELRKIIVDEWREYEVDISSFTEVTRFVFLIPKGNTYYFADIVIS